MSTYGRDDSKHLMDALGSLNMQTYPHNKITLLLAIDGDIPETNWRVIDDFVSNSSIETRLTMLPYNRGLAQALNAAAINMSSDIAYVFRFDADDLCHPQRFIEQVNHLEGDVTVGILGAAIEEFQNNGKLIGVRTYPTRNQVRDYIVKASPLAHPTVCFRRNAWDALGGYHDVSFNEDLDMWFRALKLGIVIDNLKQPLLRYRINENFFSRRSWEKAVAEYICYTKGIYQLFGVTWRLVIPFARLLFRFMPRAIVRALYSGKTFRRGILNI